jgi:hypothetical protein
MKNMMKNEDALDNKYTEEILKPEPMMDTEGHFLL